MASRLCGPETRDVRWNASLEGFWEPYQVGLPPLRERPGDLQHHARRIASVEGRPGTHGMGMLGPEDLAALRGCAFPGNLFDLRVAVLWGMEVFRASQAPRGAGEGDAFLAVEELARLPYAAAHDRFELAYLRAVAARLGRDPEAWIRHTCYARASVYRWFKRLEE